MAIALVVLVLLVAGVWPSAAQRRDRQPPSISITDPTTRSTYVTEEPHLLLAGRASDNVRVTRVTWSTSRGARGTALGTTRWSAALTLPVGDTRITVEAVDAAGNRATDRLTMTVTAPPPPPSPPLPPGPITVEILSVSDPGEALQIERCTALVTCPAMVPVVAIPWAERRWVDEAVVPEEDYCYRAAVTDGPALYPYSATVCSP